METDVIFNEDCLEGMKKIPDEFIDFVCADFPYNISNYGNSLTKVKNEIVQGDFGEWDKWENMDDYLLWVENIIKEMLRITKKNSSLIMFFDNRLAGYIGYKMEREGICKYKSPLIFRKKNPIFHVRKSGFRSSFEHAIWLINDNPNKEETIKPKTFNFLKQEEMCNVMDYVIGIKKTTHPTEKPFKLIKRLVRIFSNENDIVLDCFMGSGTTAVAAKELNRRYIGFEISKEFCEMTQKRLKQNTLHSLWN